MIDAPEREVFSLLSRGKQTFAAAESCTGGLVGHRFTNLPGASDFFLGGVIAYGNEAKVALLGVDPAALAEHGAVSEPVARQMAEGARRVFGADHAVGITGIAGPGGGTPEKPVGLVFIAVAVRDGKGVAERCQFMGGREAIKRQAADRAFEMLRRVLAAKRDSG